MSEGGPEGGELIQLGAVARFHLPNDQDAETALRHMMIPPEEADIPEPRLDRSLQQLITMCLGNSGFMNLGQHNFYQLRAFRLGVQELMEGGRLEMTETGVNWVDDASGEATPLNDLVEAKFFAPALAKLKELENAVVMEHLTRFGRQAMRAAAKQGEEMGALRLVNDVLEQRVEDLTIDNQRLSKAAYEDIVTQLDNRAAMLKWLEEKEADADVTGMIFDLNYFKQVNDLFGHSAGDAALRFLAQALEQVCRAEDWVFPTINRTGGDEFVLAAVFDGMDPSMMHKVAERLMAYLKENWVLYDYNPHDDEKILDYIGEHVIGDMAPYPYKWDRTGDQPRFTFPIFVSVGAFAGKAGDDPQKSFKALQSQGDACLYKVKEDPRKSEGLISGYCLDGQTVEISQ